MLLTSACFLDSQNECVFAHTHTQVFITATILESGGISAIFSETTYARTTNTVVMQFFLFSRAALVTGLGKVK